MSILSGLATLGSGILTGAKTVGSGLAKVGGNIGKSQLINGLKGGFNSVKNVANNLTDKYNNMSEAQVGFAKSLFSNDNTNNKLVNNDYQPITSLVDYSQYMGLSPETQRYLNRGY